MGSRLLGSVRYTSFTDKTKSHIRFILNQTGCQRFSLLLPLRATRKMSKHSLQRSLWVRSFGRMWNRICDPRSHRSRCRNGALVHQIGYHDSRREIVERVSGIARYIKETKTRWPSRIEQLLFR